jgi:hypothetical protein
VDHTKEITQEEVEEEILEVDVLLAIDNLPNKLSRAIYYQSTFNPNYSNLILIPINYYTDHYIILYLLLSTAFYKIEFSLKNNSIL